MVKSSCTEVISAIDEIRDIAMLRLYEVLCSKVAFQD